VRGGQTAGPEVKVF